LESYTERTLEAFIECLIPETPELVDDLGTELQPGGNDSGLSELIRQSFNTLQSIQLSDTVHHEIPEPKQLAPLIAVILDYGALEYILRGKADEPPIPETPGGPFVCLDPNERLQVIDYLATNSYLKRVNEWLDNIIPYTGLLDFMIDGLVTMVVMNYYGEWTGYDESENPLLPNPDSFSGDVQGWNQSKFPGQSPGYAVLKGYEVEEFEENDWS
jgi:hypothetical protein